MSRALAVLTAVVLLAASLLVEAEPISMAQGPEPSPEAPIPTTSDKHPKIDANLVAAARVEITHGRGAAADEARERGVPTVNDRLRVLLTVRESGKGAVRSAVASLGGTMEAEYRDQLQVLVPVEALERLAARAEIALVQSPVLPVSLAAGGQGPVATGASVWQLAGTTGAGVRVAVIDLGFAGLAARQAEGDLPPALTTQDFCSGGFSSATNHGTGVAEIVHEMAPAAQLMLLCVGTNVQLGQAVDYARTNGAHIIVHSVGWFNSSRGDGTGGPASPDRIASDATNAGILWVNAAGNQARTHWGGMFSDPDANGYHNFFGGDEGNGFTLNAGAQVCAALKWDSWPTTSQDYDLFLRAAGGGAVVASSTTAQTGAQPPTEFRCYTNSGGGQQSLEVAIRRAQGSASPRLDLWLYQSPQAIEYPVAAGSVLEPATSPKTLAAGAVCWNSLVVEAFSAQGPTIDGRIKPDIAGPDGVSSGTYGSNLACNGPGFYGTSAAAPHVGGAAALVKQVNPSFSPAQIHAFLVERAADLLPPGPDNASGNGKLSLGPPPVALGLPTETPTPTATATNTATATATATATPTATVTTTPCPSNRPNVGRSAGRMDPDRLQVVLTAGAGVIQSVRAVRLTNASVTVDGTALPSNGQVAVNRSSTTLMIYRAGQGAFTAELSVTDGCGPYPLFFGAGDEGQTAAPQSVGGGVTPGIPGSGASQSSGVGATPGAPGAGGSQSRGAVATPIVPGRGSSPR